MTYDIRPACIDDAAAIQRLNADEMGYDYPPEAMAAKLSAALTRKTERVFVAEVDGVVVGYVHAADYDVLYAPHMKNILGIAVAASYKRCGIGRALLCAVENWAKITDADGVRLVSGAVRTEAHAFYQSCGYEYGKDQKNFRKRVTP